MKAKVIFLVIAIILIFIALIAYMNYEEQLYIPKHFRG